MNLEEAGINFGIDPLNLDTEWVAHPQMVYNASKELAEAEREYGLAKARLKKVDARIAKDVRDSPGLFGLTKATEQAIADTVLLQDEHEEAERSVIDAHYAVRMVEAAALALEHRKRGLTLMVELWRREYYSDPSPRPESQESEEYLKRATRRRGLERERRRGN